MTQTVAIALRSINSFSGDVVRVRRDSDNVESDFTSAGVIDGSLESFCAASNGYVSDLYPQFGSISASQSTNSSQPQIVSGGSLITDTSNSKPTMLFSGSAHLQLSSPVTPKSMFFAFEYSPVIEGDSFRGLIGNASTAGTYIFLARDSGLGYAMSIDGSVSDSGTWWQNGIEIATGGNIGVFSDLIKDDLSIQTIIYGSGDPFGTVQNIGRYSTTARTFDGYISEIQIFDSDESASRSAIEIAMSDYYSSTAATGKAGFSGNNLGKSLFKNGNL